MNDTEQAEGSPTIGIDSKSQMLMEDSEEEDYALVTFSEGMVREDGTKFTRTGTRIETKRKIVDALAGEDISEMVKEYNRQWSIDEAVERARRQAILDMEWNKIEEEVNRQQENK